MTWVARVKRILVFFNIFLYFYFSHFFVSFFFYSTCIALDTSRNSLLYSLSYENSSYSRAVKCELARDRPSESPMIGRKPAYRNTFTTMLDVGQRSMYSIRWSFWRNTPIWKTFKFKSLLTRMRFCYQLRDLVLTVARLREYHTSNILLSNIKFFPFLTSSLLKPFKR